MDLKQCREFGVIIKSPNGERLASKRGFRYEVDAREWAGKSSAAFAVAACQKGDECGVGETVLLGYASAGDTKPAARSAWYAGV